MKKTTEKKRRPESKPAKQKKPVASASRQDVRPFAARTAGKGSNSADVSFPDGIAVGHAPAHSLSPQDEALFKAFQSNLLSLISHELRTPLTGILNALNLLEDGEAMGDFSEAELVKMARQNAQRLHRSLVMILDAAAVESGTFHARLREVDLSRLVRGRLDAYESLLKDQKISVEVQDQEGQIPTLGDPQKVSRAIDLCLQALIGRAAGKLSVRISSTEVRFDSALSAGMEGHWDNAWSQSVAGFHGGVASPTSLFGGVLQSEQEFLTRMEEGLGSEFILVHEIMRLHQGSVAAERKGDRITLALKFPTLSSEDALRAVLMSRAYHVSTELGSVALVLVRVPKQGNLDEMRKKLKKSLFRSSDAVYALPERKQVALVLDDCKPEDAPRLVQRLKTSLGIGQETAFGVAHCPADGLDPAVLLDLAEKRLP